MQRLNRALYDECRQNDFTFVENVAVTANKEDLHLRWNERHLRAYFEILMTLLQA